MVVLGLGSYFGFLGLGFSVDGVWGFLGFLVGVLYINIKVTLGKEMAQLSDVQIQATQ